MWILKEKRSKKEKVIIVVDLIESFKTKLKVPYRETLLRIKCNEE
jgi:hypothetical protein